jgi:hypothetical protein
VGTASPQRRGLAFLFHGHTAICSRHLALVCQQVDVMSFEDIIDVCAENEAIHPSDSACFQGVQVPRGVPLTAQRSIGLAPELYLRTGMKDGHYVNFCVYVVRAGWPVGGMYCDGHSDTPEARGGHRDFKWTWGAESPVWLCPRDLSCNFAIETFRPPIPLRPLWPGFAINTLFYAAILWLLFAAPFALRRRRRIARGLCPACAYPVGVSPVCTECGRPVPANRSLNEPRP